MRVLLTGATGFVGRTLVERLMQEGVSVRAGLRGAPIAELPATVEQVPLGAFGRDTNWSKALEGVDVVVHCAARAHILKETAADPEAEFQRANVDATTALATTAAQAGVQRFVFLSSAGVHGTTSGNTPFSEEQALRPESAYARSKLAAEDALRGIEKASRLDTVIVRPPLVYGPRVKANFLRLLGLIWSGMPLPLGAVDNLRSFVSVRNLCDFLWTCTTHPAASGQTFLVSDGQDISTPDLMRRLGEQLQVRVRLFSLPPRLLLTGAGLLGLAQPMRQLCDSLQVDVTKARTVVGWRTPFHAGDELGAMARWYRRSRGAGR